VDHTDGDITSFWMSMTLQIVVHSCLQVVTKLCLRKPWDKEKVEQGV